MVKYGGHEDQLSRKYVAMDYWRVKALMEHLDSKSLSVLEKEVLQKEIDKKTRILLQGYKKHKNWEPVAEVQGWREKTLTHIIETSLNKGDSNFRGIV